MAHSLVVNTGLYRHLNVYQARHASKEEMGKFHSEDYLNYLEQFVSKDITSKFASIGIDRFAYPSNQAV
jgi:histone deacetylase 1/2